jgi:hypothetical protein
MKSPGLGSFFNRAFKEYELKELSIIFDNILRLLFYYWNLMLEHSFGFEAAG